MGTGIAAVADWWLGMAREVAEDNEAAVAPVSTTQMAKARMAFFIIGNPF